MKLARLVLSFVLGIYCGLSSADVKLQPTHFKQLPGWEQGDQLSSLHAFQKTCQQLAKKAMPPFNSPAWGTVCEKALQTPAQNSQQARVFFEDNFMPLLVRAGGLTKGMFTGYYTPELTGSLTQQGPYQIPVYGKPIDLAQRKMNGQVEYGRIEQGVWQPYATRAQIDAGALKGKSQPVLWLKSKIDRFFLQVQGSAVVQLDQGGRIQLAFDGKNGQPYTAIGKILLEQGQLQPGQVSMQTIKAWLVNHPHQADALMEKNASFVFFKVVSAPKEVNPEGAAGVPLTPGRSLAVDRRYIPLGLPLWLVTSVPQGQQEQTFAELMVAQDTGSAIVGPIRGDVFWGVGEKAAALAGPMQSQGQYWALLPISH